VSKAILISFSGGRTSAMMTRLLLTHPMYADREKVVLFANTGREDEATLQFVKDCDDHMSFQTIWVEADITQTRGSDPNLG